ncbi:hypothetical protein C8J57DRAFT_1237189 [Mycena rebaudengoi]|nr:hypothetical protein C8J57DRAFT_1237189 [Mycena rebaudengoi]
MFKLFSLTTLLLASVAIGVVVSTPLAARDDGEFESCIIIPHARTRSASHRARIPPVMGMPSRTNEPQFIWVILEGKRGYLFTCLERSVASIEKVLKWMRIKGLFESNKRVDWSTRKRWTDAGIYAEQVRKDTLGLQRTRFKPSPEEENNNIP